MTINTEDRQTTPKLGNGVWTEIAFTFKVFATSDIVLTQTDTNGVESTLVEGGGNDYTVSLNADQNSNPGGTITLTAVSTTNYYYTATSDVENTQGVNITNLGGFFPSVINNALDRLTILVQQVLGRVDRSIKIPISDGTGVTTELPTKTVRASLLLGFDASGNATTYAFGNVSTDIDTVFTGLAANDFMQYDGSDWVNITVAEMKTALGITAFAETLLDDADAATARTTLGAQASDAGLTSIAGLTTAADKMIYTTASDTYAVTDLTSFARTFLDDATALAVRSTLEMTSSILQVVTTVKTDTFSTASSGWSDVTGLSVTITPKATTSKIILLGAVSVTGNNATDNQAYIKVLRGASTDLNIGDAASSRTRIMSGGDATSQNQTPFVPIFAEDTPGVTSATTYKVQAFPSNGGDVYVNRTENDSDTSATGRSISAIMAIEVGI